MYDHAFGTLSKKSLPNPSHQNFSPMFSSRSFKVLHFVFMPTVHFSHLTFVYVCRYRLKLFIYSHMYHQWPQHHLLKIPSFSTASPLSEINGPYMYESISGICAMHYWSVSSFATNTNSHLSSSQWFSARVILVASPLLLGHIW